MNVGPLPPQPPMSPLALEAEASDIRSAGAAARQDPNRSDIHLVNLSIGNITALETHPDMIEHIARGLDTRMLSYTPTEGREKARDGLLNVIRACGFDTEGLYAHATTGGTGAIRHMIQACTWSASPLLVVDPHYTNYSDLATQYGTQTVSVSRTLQENGEFSTIDPEAIRAKVKATGATAVVVIPYDNPSGQFIPQEALEAIAQVCVEENVWMVSDEAYRGLQYTEEGISSIWGITEDDVEGITGRRISIESASKLFNACGLRAGGLVTDNQLLHQQVVNLATAELCSPVLGQSALGALSEVSAEDLRAWIDGQREYYNDLLKRTAEGFSSATPGLIVSATQAAIYFVIDFRHIDLNFDAAAFARFCATTGKVDDIGPNGEAATLLTSPMNGSYMEPGAGATQLRIAGVGSERDMSIAPEVCNELLRQYQAA